MPSGASSGRDPVDQRLVRRRRSSESIRQTRSAPKSDSATKTIFSSLCALAIGLAAEAADFLGAEPDHADRPPRPARIHDPLRRRRGDRDAGGIVDRAGAEIPAVEMAADQHDPGVGIAARHFGDDVAG